jgi:hypothetical protein
MQEWRGCKAPVQLPAAAEAERSIDRLLYIRSF